jgi:glucose/arabinose dehydrogenase
MPAYPHYFPSSPPNDQIIILEDTNQDGKADKHKVFADSLYLPLGFELGDGGAYVTQAPNFVFLKTRTATVKLIAGKRSSLVSGRKMPTMPSAIIPGDRMGHYICTKAHFCIPR